MTQWFSPGAWRQLGKPLGGRRGGRMEDWFQRTAWWSDNSAWNTPWMTVGETRLQPLRDLVDIVVSRFTGRSLELDLQTHTARFVLDSLALDPPEDGSDARSRASAPSSNAVGGDSLHGVLREATWDDHQFERVDIEVAEVWLDMTTPPTLVTSPIDIVVAMRDEEAARWLESAKPGWSIRPLGSGRVMARPNRWIGLITRPTVKAGSVHIDVEAIDVLGRRVKLPRAIARRVARTVDVRTALELRAGDYTGELVSVTLRQPGVRRQIGLKEIRDALRGGLNRFRV